MHFLTTKYDEIITIVDNIGNIMAVRNMLKNLGIQSQITSDPEELSVSTRIILPGNGSFDACIRSLRSSGLACALEHQVIHRRVPLLGICVGAQILGHSSAEGQESGLGWLDMHVLRMPSSPSLRVPHMGWNRVDRPNLEHPLVSGISSDSRFYFMHSYYMEPRFPSSILLYTQYGIKFASGVVQNNIVGVQFHPEKSHQTGMQLLSAFAKWCP